MARDSRQSLPLLLPITARMGCPAATVLVPYKGPVSGEGVCGVLCAHMEKWHSRRMRATDNPRRPPPGGARGSAARFSLITLEYQCMLYEFISLVTSSVGYFIPYPPLEVPAEKGYVNLDSPPP